MMAYIGWIIAALVLGMVAYPILQLIPGEGQKRQVAFRQAAMRKGMQVQIRQPEMPAELAGQYPAIDRCAGYFKPCSSNLRQTLVALRSNNDREWFWVNNRRPPASIMAQLLALYDEAPDYCLAIEQSAAGTTLFLIDTQEPGQLEPLEALIDRLNRAISA